MNEQLQKALTDLVLKMTDAVNAAQGMLPELVRQLIGWQIVRDFLWIGVCAGLLIFGVIMILAVNRTQDPDDHWGWSFVGGVIAIVSTLQAASLIIEVVQLYNYPQVWVLDYLRGLAK